MSDKPIKRTVFILSDGTGITAETFSHSVLSQFESVEFKQVRVPFIDSHEKVDDAIRRINEAASREDGLPIAFTTLVNSELSARVKTANAMFMDLFAGFVEPLEQNLGVKSTHSIGKSHKGGTSVEYRNRIDAINYSLSHDDGQFVKDLAKADVILIGVSRCGKTPTSLYLAMQYGVKAANFPLIPEDFERGSLPSTLHSFRHRLFGLTIQPDRLAEVRHERRPNSKYASIEQCRYEVMEAERLMRMESIPSLSTTTKSIEEISTTVLQEINLERQMVY
ncbi:posphoenolpyruvate synthetase regulatory kinase/phosphorylase PpsR [Orrella marina]|uniref:Putative phosphoenolpyruvate synthase regulatory protein n=1 Tax=Orrella marina TaxID=2163011 RepID=A0A2R4XPA9_9BURK|nr:pyruvate, water dikinase regulatory protein [Orrella marina]AWB35652.1 phosphoenolpyruvate synthase regulatory protein [Orrella marina]